MKKIILKINGMTCSACSQGLEKYLNKQTGIISSSVNLILSTATIEYEGIKVKEIEEYIKEAGFISLGEFMGMEEETSNDIPLFILMGMLLLIIFVLTMMTMYNNFSSILYFLIAFVTAICFLFYGKDILMSGFKTLIHQMPNMDTLVSLSVITSFIYSLYGLIKIVFCNEFSFNLYFESTCMVIYFIKLGRFIERKSRTKAKSAISKLVQITPSKTLKLIDDKEMEVTLSDIKVDDILICRPGEKIAVDGNVIEGRCYVDESFITGESKPVLKEKGKNVIAGSICYDGKITYQVRKIGKDTLISEIVNLVIEATTTKNKIQRIADRVSGYFVYGIIIIAVLVFTIQLILGLPLNVVINHVATILVVACPCALGLAVPMVVTLANTLCANKGLFIRNKEVLELAKDIDTVIFDKTGTLTYGNLQISKFYNYSSYKDDELINIIANIEHSSMHPIKKAFTITEKLVVKNFLQLVGMGITAEINNKEYYLGNEKVLEKIKINDYHQEDYQELIDDASTIIYVIENKKVIALIGVKDVVRHSSKKIIQKLKEHNINIFLLTGDNKETALLIANELGIKEVYASLLPSDKTKFIKKLTNKNHKVMMIGDGINDAPSLVSATIGISINSGIDIAMDSSDVILMNNNLENILDFIKISKKSYKIMLENLCFAFLYNAIMIPIAIGLFENLDITLNPMIASILMIASSITVTLNSLRIRKVK